MSWLVEKDEDRVGNNQFFTYANFGNGEVLLSRIDYTGFGTTVGDRSVRFVYEARPLPSGSNYANDISSSYVAGGLTLQSQRLQRIETWASATEKVAAWKFGYVDHDFPAASTSRQTGRSLLQTFTQCAYEGAQETCLLKNGRDFSTQFDWWDENPAQHADKPRFAFKPLVIPDLPQSAWTIEDALIAQEELEALQQEQIAQLNVERGGVHTVADLPVQNLEGTPLGSVLAFSTIADFDGDGTRESLAQVQTATGPRTYLIQLMADRSVRSAVDVTGTLFAFPGGHAYEVVDIDGDGRSEILSHGNPLSLLAWNLPAGQAPVGNPFRTVTTNIPSGADTPRFRARLADFDGDGKPDLVTFGPHASCGSDGQGFKRGVFVHRNTIPDGAPVGASASFAQAVSPSVCLARSSGTGEYVERIADFDGDGLPDLFIHELSGTADGTETFNRILRAQPGPTFTSSTAASIGMTQAEQARNARTVPHWIDVNGDGLDDYVFATTSIAWRVRLNLGGVLGAQIDTGSTAGLMSSQDRLRYAHRLPAMDVDGDGRVDLLAPSGFAARMCAYATRQPPIPSECPGSMNTQGQCIVYLCAEEPDSGLNMPLDWAGEEIRGLYAQGQGALDSSAYTLSALRFV
ncbi:VCBS repeat-containing protein [Dokdonella sp.]|uniref:FG-GAP repeat domain-containing protein n=1 Tax=Dokdonella sp. TaxID=2291710 RepID=UPI0025C2EC3E|nr:VCBS repeat-containing protein [Dokdonella sp.]MBX3692639.1 VCBS repeat-containing protein [Dokdonella sp.]MCW5567382.1 VCBS repeat-containing protein [Dokdonella sp.]